MASRDSMGELAALRTTSGALRWLTGLARRSHPQPEVVLAPTQGHLPAVGTLVALVGSQVHPVRLPSFVVSTEVLFALPDERLSIRHDSGSTPTPYVGGTVLAARAVTGLTGLGRGLGSLVLGG
jgi:4-hydroxy-tetrahydrodipicolinate reductase